MPAELADDSATATQPPATAAPTAAVREHAFAFASLVIAALSFGLGLIGLDRNDVWFDEAISLSFARQPLASFASVIVRNDTHGPLYYVLLKAWTALVGERDWVCRLPSTILAATTVWLTARLGARVASPKVGLAAAGLVGLAPLHIYYAQEIRFYSLVECMATLHVLCFLELLDDEPTHAWTWMSWAGFVASGLAFLLTFYMSALLVIADAVCVAFLWGRTSHKPRIVSALAVVAALFCAWMPWFLWQVQHTTGSIAWIQPTPPWKLMAELLRTFAAGEHVSWTSTVAALSFAGAVLAALVLGRRETRRQLLPIACWLFVPLLAALAISMRKPLSLPRYYLMLLPAFFLMVAAGARQVVHRRLRVALGAAALAALLIADVHYYRTFKFPERWRDAVAYVRGHLGPSDVIAGIPDYSVAELAHYFPGRAEIHGFRPGESLERVLVPGRRVWLFSTAGAAEELLTSSAQKAALIERRQFGTMEVRCLLPAQSR